MIRFNIINQKFGQLTAVKSLGYGIWECICECGNKKIVKSDKLRSGHTKSCGCLCGERMQIEVKVGTKYGDLIVIEKDRTRSRQTYWICICSCGKMQSVQGYNLTRGITKSCGCRQQRATRIMIGCKSEYKAWHNMKRRCLNPKVKRYKDYGGRGIVICDQWIESFQLFFKDMGLKPSPKHTLDRIDNDGNYEPGNCRWATYAQQNINRRKYERQKK